MKCFYGEVLMSGPAGTGKSRACLERMHALASHRPGFRGLILRRTRESLTESGLVTFENHVVEANHPILRTGGQRKMRQSYHYPNGSEIVVGGLDKPGKIMSTEYDCAYVQEGIELEEDAWEALTTRLRNGKLPYQQIIADTNPGAPGHWLNRRCLKGVTKMIPCHHEDNPLWYDQGKWTERGLVYLAKLDALTGPRKERLRYGRWVQAEGVVYDGWDPRVHLVDRFPIPLEWPRFWSIDFGYTNPFACLMFAEDHDGRRYVYREIYQTMTLVEDHAKRMLALLQAEAEEVGKRLNADPAKILHRLMPRAIVCDSEDAEGRATLGKYLNMTTQAAKKGPGSVRAGIEVVAKALRVQPDGRPRLMVLRDSLDRRDPLLEDAKRPCSMLEEIDCYVWNNKVTKDEPNDKDNHALDALRYGMCRGPALSEMEVPTFAPAAPVGPGQTRSMRISEPNRPARRLGPRK